MLSALEGTFKFVVGDEEVLVAPGGFVFVPPMTPHAFVGTDGRGGKMIELFTPGEFEGYFDEIARVRATGGSRQDIEAAQAKYGMEVLGPPMGPR